MTEQNQIKTGPIPQKSAWQPEQKIIPGDQLNRAQTRPEADENRERQSRDEVHQSERRRRKSGSLNRMVQFRLDFIPPEMLDLDNWVYRWVNDETNKIRMVTKHDDYQHVLTSELKGFDPDAFDSEGSETVRMLVGTQGNGQAQYSYLLKKRRTFWEDDNEESVRNREDMMAGRVHRAEIGSGMGAEADLRDSDFNSDNYYAPSSNRIGGAAERRRGPIPKR